MKLEDPHLIREFVYKGDDKPELTKVIHGEVGRFHFATNGSIALAVEPWMCGGLEVVHNGAWCDKIHDVFVDVNCTEFFCCGRLHQAAHRAFNRASEFVTREIEADGFTGDLYDEIVKRSFVRIGSVVIQSMYAVNIFRMRLALAEKEMTIGVDADRQMVLARFSDPETRKPCAKILVMGVVLENTVAGSCVFDAETAELVEVE